MVNALEPEYVDLAVYNSSQTETVFQKMRWVYTGQEPFEDYVHRMGSSARSLAVGTFVLKIRYISQSKHHVLFL